MTRYLKHLIILLIFSTSLILSLSCNISTEDVFISSSNNNEEVQKEDKKEEDTTPPPSTDNNKAEQDGTSEGKKDTNTEGNKDETPPPTTDDKQEQGDNTEQDKKPTVDETTNPDKEEKPTPPITPPSEDKEEGDTKPPKEENIPSDNPNKDSYVQPDNIPSLPDAIVNQEIMKLKAHPSTLDDNYMYIMVRFTGLGSGWKQDEDIYPRGFVLGFNEGGQSKDHFINGFDNTPERNPIPGRGYTKETGFCPDNTGNNFYTNFYCGFEGMRTLIYGSSDIMFKFTNFVIWDQLNDGILGGGFDHPAFVRYPEQNPLKIIVPMKTYDSSVHNNVAYFTIYFELLGNGQSKYYAVFDGFEPK